MEPLAHNRNLLAEIPELDVACCVTFAQPADADLFVARAGAAATPLEEMSFVDVVREVRPVTSEQVLLLDVRDGWVVALEPQGYQGSRTEVLRAVSAQGRAMSVYWNVNANARLAYAAHGEVLVSVDLAVPQQRRGREPHVLDQHLAELPFATDEQAAALVAAERVCGIRLDEAWLRARHRCVLIEPLRSDLVPAGHHGHPALADAELQAIIHRPGPEHLPLITALAAELLARHAGIDGEPPVAETLDVLRSRAPARPNLADRLTVLVEDYAARRRGAAGHEQAERLHDQGLALQAIRAALDPNPAKAAWDVCWQAGNVVSGDFGDQLRLAVLSRLIDRVTGAR